MKGLVRVEPIRLRPFRDERALAEANGENVAAQRATSWAWTIAAFISLLALVRVLVGCTPADTAALGVAARTAQAVACTVCGTAEPDVQAQAAALSKSIAQLTEAIAVLAAARDAPETAARLAALRAREEEQRADFERLVQLAGLAGAAAAKAIPPPPPTSPPPNSAPPAPPPSVAPAALTP